MIKFFRNLRRKLLKENRFNKYLLYAIGEIILVVIGILIALQINNANENAKENVVLKGYLQNINKNLDTDIGNLKDIKQFRDSVRKGASIFMSIANKEQMTYQDYSVLANRYLQKYNVFFDTYFRADKSGFETLKNSGYLGKIQGSELETKLFSYYNLISEIEDGEVSFNNFIEEMEYEIFKTGMVMDLVSLMRTINQKNARNKLDEIHKIMNIPAFKSANFRSAGYNYLINKYLEAIKLAEELKTLLRDD